MPLILIKSCLVSAKAALSITGHIDASQISRSNSDCRRIFEHTDITVETEGSANGAELNSSNQPLNGPC